ncbi:hypothetical protein B0H17DRAFT_1152980 [Mycena rosella]|uniref:Uncharacterized protein n=1 Tax=Mycena rosella TaxID=1033263 RepID=A0AAD7B8X6_MYCRO|nr:hypothetical protein B0H17DRAFT_1152980 [Mycena rosella]
MGTHSKVCKTWAANLLQNLTNKTKRAWDELSPKKLQKWLSPKKRQKENMPAVENTEIEPRDASDELLHASDTSDTLDTSDPFAVSMQSFHVAHFTQCASDAPAAREFTWKLLKPTIEEVEDEDDRWSTYTFPAPTEPRPFPASSSLFEGLDDPLDSVDVPEADDELLATKTQATRSGVRRQAPNLGEAKVALECVQKFLHRELRGTNLWGRQGVGYKDPNISAFTWNQLIGIQMMLNFYLTPGLEGGTYRRWGASACLAADGLRCGAYCARMLAALAWQFILNQEVLDVNPYREWNESMLADEDLANDIRLHLQSLGKEITAEKLVDDEQRSALTV